MVNEILSATRAGLARREGGGGRGGAPGRHRAARQVAQACRRLPRFSLSPGQLIATLRARGPRRVLGLFAQLADVGNGIRPAGGDGTLGHRDPRRPVW